MKTAFLECLPPMTTVSVLLKQRKVFGDLYGIFVWAFLLCSYGVDGNDFDLTRAWQCRAWLSHPPFDLRHARDPSRTAAGRNIESTHGVRRCRRRYLQFTYYFLNFSIQNENHYPNFRHNIAFE